MKLYLIMYHDDEADADYIQEIWQDKAKAEAGLARIRQIFKSVLSNGQYLDGFSIEEHTTED